SSLIHSIMCYVSFFFFFQAEDGIRDLIVTGVQTCALPISEKNLPPELIDAVDEQKLLAIKPPPLKLPPEHERKLRHESVLPEYRSEERRVGKECRSRRWTDH